MSSLWASQPSGQLSALLFPKRHFLWLQPIHCLVLGRGLLFPSFTLSCSSKDSPSSCLPATKTQAFPTSFDPGAPLYWVSRVVSSTGLTRSYTLIFSVSPPAPSTQWQSPEGTSTIQVLTIGWTVSFGTFFLSLSALLLTTVLIQVHSLPTGPQQ